MQWCFLHCYVTILAFCTAGTLWQLSGYSSVTLVLNFNICKLFKEPPKCPYVSQVGSRGMHSGTHNFSFYFRHNTLNVKTNHTTKTLFCTLASLQVGARGGKTSCAIFAELCPLTHFQLPHMLQKTCRSLTADLQSWKRDFLSFIFWTRCVASKHSPPGLHSHVSLTDWSMYCVSLRQARHLSNINYLWMHIFQNNQTDKNTYS